MYNNAMTKYSSIADFQPESLVTREQAAKFFVAFDRSLGRDAETEMYCVYSDEAIIDATLMNSVQSACNRKLMLGSAGKFRPTEALTKAQALAVIIRIKLGQKDETGNPRWSMYFTEAKSAGYTKESNVWNLDKPVTRYELALLLRRVDHPIAATDMSEVLELLQQFGLQTE